MPQSRGAPRVRRGSKAEADLRFEGARAQLTMYARDLRVLAASERAQREELEATRRQLQIFARDMRTAFQAERRQRREVERAYKDTIWRLTRVAQYKDSETGAHIRRLCLFSEVVALHVGLSGEEADRIAAASPMHDIGKIGVPDAVLNRKGPLTRRGWEAMRRHAGFGASLLKGSTSPLLELAGQIALTHHERWDGSGYPQGLRGEQIPLPGRIVMLVDQYDALRSRRPYKEPFDHDRTCDILLNGDGRTLTCHFDPMMLETFRSLRPKFKAIYDSV